MLNLSKRCRSLLFRFNTLIPVYVSLTYVCCNFSTKKRYRFTSIHALSVALRESLLKDRLTPVISEESLEAIHRRVEKFLQEIRKCIDRNTIQNVIIAS